jgi:L-ribulose-5-phosphate 4-epimerase
VAELDALRQEVLAANLALPHHGLVVLTSGNASGIDRDRGLVAIKPSGVSYESMSAEDLVIVDLDGNLVAGERRPSTDTPTHLALYRAFDEIGGIVHTHSTWATSWAQAQREIPLLGTTHADFSAHPVPVTRPLSEAEIDADYEAATGDVIIETVGELGPLEVPAVLVRGHAPFCWAPTPAKAVETAVTLEQVAELAAHTNQLESNVVALDELLRNKHHRRKHGPQAYYGQS